MRGDRWSEISDWMQQEDQIQYRPAHRRWTDSSLAELQGRKAVQQVHAAISETQTQRTEDMSAATLITLTRQEAFLNDPQFGWDLVPKVRAGVKSLWHRGLLQINPRAATEHDIIREKLDRKKAQYRARKAVA